MRFVPGKSRRGLVRSVRVYELNLDLGRFDLATFNRSFKKFWRFARARAADF